MDEKTGRLSPGTGCPGRDSAAVPLGLCSYTSCYPTAAAVHARTGTSAWRRTALTKDADDGP